MDNINLQRIEGYTVQLVAEDVWESMSSEQTLFIWYKVKKVQL